MMQSRLASILLRQCAPHMRSISELMIESEDMQWMAPAGSSSLTADGLSSDPTGEAATDERRLRLRDARKRAIRELTHAEKRLHQAAVELERAVNAWKGDL